MQNKVFYIAIALVSLVAIWWLSSSNTDEDSLSESAKNAPVSPLSRNAKSAATPEVFYSPKNEAKSKPVGNLQSPLATQPEAMGEAANGSMRESRVPGDDPTPGSEEVVNAEPGSEYIQREDMEIKTANPQTENPEMQNLAQQLQAMRDAGLDEAVMREVEEKLIELQRLQDQQTISKSNAEDGSADLD
ncbi:MAG: hypothetical protein V4732_07765 [Pseudomonadota bacterium]